MMDWRWKFQASLLRVIDGDTFWMRVDCGFRVFAEHSFRLWGVHCPELNTEPGKAAARFVLLWFAEHIHGEPESRFVLETDRDRTTFNRYISRVACPEGHDLGAAIVAAGYGGAA